MQGVTYEKDLGIWRERTAAVQDGTALAARASEYESATMRWLYDTVENLMRARDSIYARITSERVEVATRAADAVEFADGQDMAVEPYRIHAAGAVEVEPLISGDFEDLHTVVSSIAASRRS